MVGTRLGHFEITALLGQGGMGSVYRAQDTRLGRDVAIKILPEAFAGDAERLSRFRREAQVVAGLNHPNICALYDVGQADDVDYLVMELVEGQSLAQRIEQARGGLPPDEAVGVATQIADALEAAHARGIVHRDLKPANVMLTPEGVAKVLDFGLAKGRDPGDSGAGVNNSPTLTHQTQAGMILGTAGYMSPEQARGGVTDQRADVWAWGVILYEMTTGRKLFEGPTVSDTLAAVLRADPEWDQLPPETPRRLRRVLRRCLERDPRMRLHSIADARIELVSGDPENEAEAAGTVAVRPGGRAVWLAAAVALLALAVGAAGWWMRPAAVEPPLRILQVASGSRLDKAVISPDGQRVALNRGGQMYLRELDSTAETRIEGAEDLNPMSLMAWSPDGRRIAYATFDEIYTIPVSGGAPQRACEIPDSTYSDGIVLGLTFLTPETLVFALDARGLWQVPVVGGEPEVFLQPDREAKHEVALHLPSLLPDGKTILSRVRWRNRPNDTFTFLRNGKRTDVTFPDWTLMNGIVTPSGHLVFIRARQDAGLWAVPFSLDTLLATGDPVRLLAGRFDGLSRADDDTLVVTSTTEGVTRTAVVDRQGRVQKIWDGVGYQRDPAVSPDGKKLATWGLEVFDGQRGVEVTPERGSGPTWSPDGRELIYEGPGGLWRVPADGSRDPVQVMEGEVETPDWSPNGQYVAFTLKHQDSEGASERDALLGRTRKTDIGVLKLGDSAGPQSFRDSPANEMYPRFSPDGRYMAYASDASDRFEIYVTPFPTGDRRWQISEHGGRYPRWSRDGREIFFVAGTHLMAARFGTGTDVEIGAPASVMSASDLDLRFADFGQACYDVTPDGNFVVLSFQTDEPQTTLLIQNWRALFERER